MSHERRSANGGEIPALGERSRSSLTATGSEGWWRASRRVALGLRLHPSGADGRIRSDVEPPEVRYARTVDGVNIAYHVRGDGPVDLVYTLGMAGNFEIEFEAPWGTRFLERLASFSRVILFDKRGTGLSDRVLGAPDFDMRADDLRAVLDAAGSERAVIVGSRGGGVLPHSCDAPRPGLRSRPLQLLGTDSVGAGLPRRGINR